MSWAWGIISPPGPSPAEAARRPSHPAMITERQEELAALHALDLLEGEEKAAKPKKKKPAADNAAMESFLERNKPQKVIFPNITDLATWKKKFKVDDDVKVFICTGGYPDIKKALKKRGWVHNKDPSSPCFDFKWVLKSKDIDHNTLNDS